MTLMAEWQSSDSYATRFSKVNNGISGYKLNYGTTVKTGGDGVTLTAATGSGDPAVDWFFGTFTGSNPDIMVNYETGEHINNS